MTHRKDSQWRLAAYCVAGALALLPPGLAAQDSSAAALAPEAASTVQLAELSSGQGFAVAAANPLAAEAGVRMLRAGGSAMDAAIAVQMVLGLVEPQSSGIGGGAFLLHFDGREVLAWDGRETAPAAVSEAFFLDAEGLPLPFLQAAASGRSVGVPGLLRMLEAAHRQHGRLPWAALFEPAIELAERGFALSPRLHTLLDTDPALRDNAAARSFFYHADGTPLPVGHLLTNPALAEILRRLASEGSEVFYQGDIARDLVMRVAQHPQAPGLLAASDLTDYRPVLREAMCTDWRTFSICGFPPPSSGHLAIMQILGILHALPETETTLQDNLPGESWLHRFIEANRLAFADRAVFVADPAFVSPPGDAWHSMLSPGYLQQRAQIIGTLRVEPIEAGQPAGSQLSYAPQATQADSGTSHISIIDAEGNAVAMTSTIEAAFGARILADGGTDLAGGYLLNNQLTDFSFKPRNEAGTPIANRVEPGKRPRSSMSPTLIFDRDSGKLLASLGSPGGAAIIAYTARSIIAMFDWGLNPQQAVALPHAVTLGGPVFIEQGLWPVATQEGLRTRGHNIFERELTSGIQAIVLTPQGWQGGADPRREGVVLGD